MDTKCFSTRSDGKLILAFQKPEGVDFRFNFRNSRTLEVSAIIHLPSDIFVEDILQHFGNEEDKKNEKLKKDFERTIITINKMNFGFDIETEVAEYIEGNFHAGFVLTVSKPQKSHAKK